MKKIFWIPIGVLAVVILVALVAYYQGDKPKGAILTRKGEKAVTATIAKDQRVADEKKQARDRSATAAEKPIVEANTAAQRATALRIQTHQKPKPKSNAKPVPVSDSTAAELQRFFTSYGR